jgi:hypothetical protein
LFEKTISGLAHCTSRLSFKHILLALGINVWPLTPTTRNFGLRIRDPWQYQNLTFFDYLRVAASKDDTATNLKLQEASLHHSHKADCFDYGRRKIFAVYSAFHITFFGKATNCQIH